MNDRLITWENFVPYIKSGHPQSFVPRGDPKIELYVSESGSRIGLRTPCKNIQEVVKLRMAFVDCRQVVKGDVQQMDLSTNVEEVFTTFFSLACDIANRVQLGGVEAALAACQAFDAMKELGKQSGVMSTEEQHGLYGELWILRRLLKQANPVPLQAWTGPERDAHDFRLEDVEIEVKTTIGSKRVHKINNKRQLLATPGRTLYLASVMLCPALRGKSLPQLVEEVRELLPEDARSAYAESLESYGTHGYRAQDAIHYGDLLDERAPVALVPIDEKVPAITPAVLEQALGADVATRIDGIQYDVNVEGLGMLDETPQFLKILPSTK